MNAAPVPEASSEAAQRYQRGDSAEIVRQQTEQARNIGALLVTGALQKQGWTPQWVDGRTTLLEKDGRQILHQGHRGAETPVGMALVGDKFATKRLLQAAGVATPQGRIARSAEEALQFHQELGSPIVIKPRLGMKQAGVTVNLNSAEEIRAAFERAAAVKGGVLVEEFRPGDEEYRCLTTAEQCVSVVRRLLPRVTGDGVSTVQELITGKNATRQRIPSTFDRPIPLDSVTQAHLARLGWTLQDVLPVGQELIVRDIGGLSTGGEPHECFGSVDGRVKEMAATAAAAIPGLAWGGVDVMIARETGEPFVIEINSDADISGVAFPIHGEPAAVAEMMVEARIAAAEQDMQPPQVCAPRADSPVSVGEYAAGLTERPARKSAYLSSLVPAFLEGEGYAVEVLDRGVVRAEGGEADALWFHYCLGLEDLAVVGSVISRHGTARRLLRLQGVPLMPWRTAKTWRGFVRFREELNPAAVRVVPFFRPWNAGAGKFFSSVDEVDRGLFTGRTTWVLQETHGSARFGVLATRDEALMVTARKELPAGSEWRIEAVSQAAVQAVRAVPGLRWAWVDVAFTSSAFSERPAAAVEGMTLNPLLSPKDLCLAGSLDDALRAITARR